MCVEYIGSELAVTRYAVRLNTATRDLITASEILNISSEEGI